VQNPPTLIGSESARVLVVSFSVHLTVIRAGLSKRGALARFGCNGERGVRAYNWDLGAEPPAGSPREEPPVGVRGRMPPEAECLFYCACPKEAANLPHY